MSLKMIGININNEKDLTNIEDGQFENILLGVSYYFLIEFNHFIKSLLNLVLLFDLTLNLII